MMESGNDALLVATDRGLIVATREAGGWQERGRSLVERQITSVVSREGVILAGTTGGVDLGGQVSKHLTQWTPPSGAAEQEVHFWFVVRDGRGGLSWIRRTLHYLP